MWGEMRLLTPYLKNNSQWLRVLALRLEIIKFLKGNRVSFGSLVFGLHPTVLRIILGGSYVMPENCACYVQGKHLFIIISLQFKSELLDFSVSIVFLIGPQRQKTTKAKNK